MALFVAAEVAVPVDPSADLTAAPVCWLMFTKSWLCDPSLLVPTLPLAEPLEDARPVPERAVEKGTVWLCPPPPEDVAVR